MVRCFLCFCPSFENYVDMGTSGKPVALISGEGSTKTLRQLHAEEDDEERFQADLKKAVRQSLGNVLTAFTYACFFLCLG